MSLSHVVRTIRAPRERVWRAFMDPADLLAWLPPGEMTGRFHRFDPRPGGGYSMSLYYPETETAFRGKTADREDRAEVRFVEIDPPERLVEAVAFASDDPAFAGEMTIVVTLAETPGGTEVAMDFANLPPGLKPQDNAEGARLSLENLARLVE